MIYLAGPFFNSAQVAHLKRIEEMSPDIWSPRLENLCAPNAGEAEMEKAYRTNLEKIDEADYVLFVLDYKLPPDMKMLTVSLPDVETVKFASGLKSLLVHTPGHNIPDTGTLVELGYAIAKGKPCIAFYERPPRKVNLMLMCGFAGTCYGWDELRLFFFDPATALGHKHNPGVEIE